MPAERKGLLFRHFEKLACGVVGALLVVSLLYLATRTSGNKVEALRVRIDEVAKDLKEGLGKGPPPQPEPQWVEAWESVGEVAESVPLRPKFMEAPLPHIYAGASMGIEKEQVLSFDEPLVPGTVSSEDKPAKENLLGAVVASLEHPVGPDYSKVRVRTIGPGTARIEGEAESVRHIYPIVVDAKFGRRADPPLEVAATSRRDGVLITFVPNPLNREGVVVQQYQVFRKRARAVGEDFRLIHNVPRQDAELSDEGRELLKTAGISLRGRGEVTRSPRAGGAEDEIGLEEEEIRSRVEEMRRRMMVPYAFGSPETPEEEPDEKKGVSYRWLDDSAARASGEEFLYQVRTVAYFSHPGASEFCETVAARALATRDFRLTQQRGDTLKFEVAVYTDGRIRKETFYNAVGDEIGGLKRLPSGQMQNYLTGCYILDYHKSVARETEGGMLRLNNRIVYVDRHGDVTTRWRRDVDVPYLFTTTRTAETTAPGTGRRVTPPPAAGTGRPIWMDRYELERPYRP